MFESRKVEKHAILTLLLLSYFKRVRRCVTPYAAHQAPRPWDSPGKSTGVGCHRLLRILKLQTCNASLQEFLSSGFIKASKGVLFWLRAKTEGGGE